MSLAGWILLFLSCGSITALTSYCYWKILASPRSRDEVHAPLDIDTQGC